MYIEVIVFIKKRRMIFMSNKLILKYFISIITVCFISAFGDNPITQTCFTADPAPMVFKERVYVYVGVDSSAAPDNSYLMRYYKCYSSKDMVNWTDHGIVLKTSEFSWSGGEADAAQVIEHNGKFYYHISTNATGGIALGIAVADNPLGPFKDVGNPVVTANQMSGCNATHSWRGLDPTILIDDDEQAYLYWGNNVFYWVKLNADLISITGNISCIAANNSASFGPDYEEAPWVYKRNNLYYLVYASQFPECIRYSTSSTATGPWTYKGQIMGTQPNGVSNTIHPGVVDFGGKSYFFYHNAGLPNGGSYRRAVCVEQFEYNQDGTIPSIKETSGGVDTGVTSLNPYDTIQAETICWSSGVRTGICSEGGIHVDSIHNSDCIKVEGVDFETGASSFDARVASNTSGGKIELHLDSQNGTLIGTCDLVSTGGFQTWTTKSCAVSGATGKHDLFLKFTGGSGVLFNFNWWKFNQIKVGNGLQANIKHNTLKIISNTGKIMIDNIPVPTSNSNEIIEIKLFDLSGRFISMLYSGIYQGKDKLSVDLSGLRPGSYVVNVMIEGKFFSFQYIM
jgi:hypothetical protein